VVSKKICQNIFGDWEGLIVEIFAEDEVCGDEVV
jgi:hypothetical protein